jgi:hypothetical protein
MLTDNATIQAREITLLVMTRRSNLQSRILGGGMQSGRLRKLILIIDTAV